MTSDTTATAVGDPPAPNPEKDVSLPNTPRTVTRFWLLAAPEAGVSGTKAGRRQTRRRCSADARDLTDGAAQLAGIFKVH